MDRSVVAFYDEEEGNDVENGTKTKRFDPVIEAYKTGIDRSLIRVSLRRSIAERFEVAMDAQRFAEELRRAGREARKRKLL
ncbi:MAG: hypothetical protein ABL967_13625 [Bryobacteraceae bacterium]